MRLEKDCEVDLLELSLKDLKKLEKDVAAAIAGFADREKSKARTQLEALAKELGFTLAELVDSDSSTKKSRAPAQPKYRNPADASDVWSGRGRKPRWFIAAIEAGKAPEDLAI